MTETQRLVAVIEAGEGYIERVATCRIAVSSDDTGTSILDRACDAVAAMGYRVMPDSEGGCIEMVEQTGDEAYIGVTVYPKA